MKIKFLTLLKYQRVYDRTVDGRGLFRLTHDLNVRIPLGNGTSYILTIPKGFETDLASVPEWADNWFGINPDDPGAIAAVLHDFLYKHHDVLAEIVEGILKASGQPHNCGGYEYRRSADLMFLHGLKARKVKWYVLPFAALMRRIKYVAVRIGGERGFYSDYNPQGDTT